MNKETSRNLLFLTGLGLAGALGWQMKECQLPNPDLVNIKGESSELKTEKSTAEEEEFLQIAIKNFLIGKSYDGPIFQQILANNPSEATVSLSHQVSRDYFERGVAFLQLKLPDNIKPSFRDSEGKILVFQNRQFDLSNLYQFHLAQALLDKSLEVYLPENSPQRSEGSIVNQLNLLWWLKDQEFNIRFEPDSYAFFEPDKMVAVAGSLYHTQNDIPKPPLIQFYRLDDPQYREPENADGYYACTSFQNIGEVALRIFNGDFFQQKKCPILSSNIQDNNGIVHEIGHYVGFNSERFNQDQYNKRIGKIRDLFKEQITHQSDTYLSEHAADHYQEDFAETFSWYITKGSDFRQLLQQMRWWDTGAHKILLAKYQFFKEKFGNKEFLLNGILADSFDLGARHDLAGKTFLVKNMSPEPFKSQGIHLRKNPGDLGSIDESLVVYDGQLIRISQGPVIWGNSRTGETYTMYKVSAINNEAEITGWLAIEWLGENFQNL